ncbi:MAG: SCO family protein [Burkholderiaceae bacterium]
MSVEQSEPVVATSDSSAEPANRATPGANKPKPKANNKRVLLLLAAVCIAPVVASYTAYYFLPPEGRTNYGDLVNPQVDTRSLETSPLADTLPVDEKARLGLDTPLAPKTPDVTAGETVSLNDWRGRWLMVLVAPAACDSACQTNLYNMRQVRLTTGKHRDRVQRLWLVTDDVSPAADLLKQHAGMVTARVAPATARSLFQPATGQQPVDHIFLIDPLGNLMMRFPAQTDPSKMKKDINKLLKASRIG